MQSSATALETALSTATAHSVKTPRRGRPSALALQRTSSQASNSSSSSAASASSAAGQAGRGSSDQDSTPYQQRPRSVPIVTQTTQPALASQLSSLSFSNPSPPLSPVSPRSPARDYAAALYAQHSHYAKSTGALTSATSLTATVAAAAESAATLPMPSSDSDDLLLEQHRALPPKSPLIPAGQEFIDVPFAMCDKYGTTKLLISKVPLAYFLAHHIDTFAPENLYFLLDMFVYGSHLGTVFDTYLSQFAVLELNISQATRLKALQAWAGVQPEQCFDLVKREVFTMLDESWTRYAKSKEWKDMLRQSTHVYSLQDRNYAVAHLVRALDKRYPAPAGKLRHAKSSKLRFATSSTSSSSSSGSASSRHVAAVAGGSVAARALRSGPHGSHELAADQMRQIVREKALRFVRHMCGVQEHEAFPRPVQQIIDNGGLYQPTTPMTATYPPVPPLHGGILSSQNARSSAAAQGRDKRRSSTGSFTTTETRSTSREPRWKNWFSALTKK
ncbi:G-protein signaling regulator protein [Sorochytrium milnesiophthora]